MKRYLKFALPILFTSLVAGCVFSLCCFALGIDSSYPFDYVSGMFIGGVIFRKEDANDN